MASSPQSSSPLRALVDTNVVLDLLLGREPWATQAKPLWDARDNGRLELYLLASVLTDIFYICRKQVGIDRAKAAVEECMQRFVIITLDRAIIETALALPGTDFEDNVQIAGAQAFALDLIVTRNVADYRLASLPVVEPPNVLSHLVP